MFDEAEEIGLRHEEGEGNFQFVGFDSFHSLWLCFYIRLRPFHPIHILVIPT